MNVPDVHVIEVLGHKFIVAINSGLPDNFRGTYWYLYRHEDGKVLAYGQSRGFDGVGGGSALSARALARAAAHRRVRRKCAASLMGEFDKPSTPKGSE